MNSANHDTPWICSANHSTLWMTQLISTRRQTWWGAGGTVTSPSVIMVWEEHPQSKPRGSSWWAVTSSCLLVSFSQSQGPCSQFSLSTIIFDIFLCKSIYNTSGGSRVSQTRGANPWIWGKTNYLARFLLKTAGNAVHSPTNMLKWVWESWLWKPVVHTNMSKFLRTNNFLASLCLPWSFPN